MFLKYFIPFPIPSLQMCLDFLAGKERQASRQEKSDSTYGSIRTRARVLTGNTEKPLWEGLIHEHMEAKCTGCLGILHQGLGKPPPAQACCISTRLLWFSKQEARRSRLEKLFSKLEYSEVCSEKGGLYKSGKARGLRSTGSAGWPGLLCSPGKWSPRQGRYPPDHILPVTSPCFFLSTSHHLT